VKIRQREILRPTAGVVYMSHLRQTVSTVTRISSLPIGVENVLLDTVGDKRSLKLGLEVLSG